METEAGARKSRHYVALCREYAPVALAVFSGLALSTGLYFTMARQVAAVARYDFSEEAKSAIGALERELNENIDKVRWMGATLSAAPELRREQFEILAQSMSKGAPGSLTLQWAPRVGVSARRDFEAAARASTDPAFAIRGFDRDPDAESRDALFPIYYAQRGAGAPDPAGIDLGSDPVLLRYLHLAAEKGEMFFVSEAPALERLSRTRAVLAICPVYAPGPEARPARLLGFSTGLFQMERLAEAALAPFNQLEIDIHAFDFFGANGNMALLYRPGSSQTRTEPYVFEHNVQLLSGLNYVGQFPLGETRRWIVACTPSPDYAFGIQSWSPLLGLAMGLAFTAVLAYHFHANVRQRRAAEGLVVRRTAELKRTNERLVHEAAERKRFELERDGLMELLEASNASLQALNTRLERSNRDLQDFALVASHDLKEPLRKVRALARTLRDKLGEPTQNGAGEYLELMEGALQRMHNLITNLLRVSRVSTHGQPFVRVELGRLCEEVVSDLAIRIEETGGAIEVGQIPAIEADPMQMRQIIQNILENSLKYHRDGVPPRIRIDASTRPSNGEAGTCTLIFRDNGMGFAPEFSERAFTLFQRLDNGARIEGSGVGLAVCRKIAERHGGTITVESEAGKGSTFVITLPLSHTKGSAPTSDETVPHE